MSRSPCVVVKLTGVQSSVAGCGVLPVAGQTAGLPGARQHLRRDWLARAEPVGESGGQPGNHRQNRRLGDGLHGAQERGDGGLRDQPEVRV